MTYVSPFKTLFKIGGLELIKKYKNDFKNINKISLLKSIEFDLIFYFKYKDTRQRSFTLIDITFVFHGDHSYYTKKYPNDYEKYQYCYLTKEQKIAIPTPMSAIYFKMFSNKWYVFTSNFAYYSNKISFYFLSNKTGGYTYKTNFFKRLFEFLGITSYYHGELIRIFWWKNIEKIKKVNRKMCEDSARRSRIFRKDLQDLNI